ncbi:ADP-ribosylglycohydrolase family protein [Terasakiella sp.]|uniref:ADP-ribosylglycohydrolase family protein n=1 Tax=Terasakiella sp. TaxID=2034861 RepID=UPI003AA9C00A
MRIEKSQIINSALWAAYGDAVGFITELASSDSLVKRRSGVTKIIETISWKRQVGGKFGTLANLPAGCYSDDTQLRLSTCRAILGNGKFDAESFAKIELPVWLSYALGAGRGSKAAANNLGQSSVNWNTNFFKDKRSSYFQCGGNGAAMRIQPHVWAATPDTSLDKVMLNVIKNSITTHGHARGILGAVFHANCLSFALNYKELPPPDEWLSFVNFFSEIPKIVSNDPELSAIWLPIWESENGTSFEYGCEVVARECRKDISSLIELIDKGASYSDLVHSIGGFEDKTRGSGTKTAILSVAHAWLYRRASIKEALLAAANLLNSDTDTIATMSGAILGCVTKTVPSDRLADRQYIEDQAQRCWNIANGNKVENFNYPDLFKWKTPKTQLDVVQILDQSPYVIGLGKGSLEGEEFKAQSGKPPASWQWIKLDFGQKVLCKRRETLAPADPIIVPSKTQQNQMSKVKNSEPNAQNELFGEAPVNRSSTQSNISKKRDLHALTNDAISSNFDPYTVGQNLLEAIGDKNSIEDVVAYSAIIAKAVISRKAKNRS